MKKNNPHKIESEWDEYWLTSNRKGIIRKIYDLFARFYRNFLIGPSFKFYMNKYFSKNSQLLHAGCGGGEVDNFVIDHYTITAVDISSEALSLYIKINPETNILKMNIFDMNLNNNKFDGIYNLGVVEHFSKNQFEEMMLHFKSHLKKTGKIILFWPPKYGLSVIALKLIYFIINKILRIKIQLHPDEPFLYNNRLELEKILKPLGLKITNSHFNYKDAFTHVIVVIELV